MSGIPSNTIVDAIKAQMPGLKTQAQFDVLASAFNALLLTLNSIFEGKPDLKLQGNMALDKALDLAEQVTDLGEDLKDVPESATSRDANQFRKPPAQFQEYEEQARLLAECEACSTLEGLTVWYAHTKDRRDLILNQDLRNKLIDTIRGHQLTLQAQEKKI